MPNTRRNGTILVAGRPTIFRSSVSHYSPDDVINWCREKYGENWDKKKKSKRKAEARYALGKAEAIKNHMQIVPPLTTSCIDALNNSAILNDDNMKEIIFKIEPEDMV